MTRAVIDTNVLVSALSSRSPYHWIVTMLLDEQYELYITDEILLEHQEVLSIKYSDSVASNFLLALNELPNVKFVRVYFQWNLIVADPDDNKFIDCYVAASADSLVTHDAHFQAVKSIPFPKINLLKMEEFAALVSYKA